MLVLGAGSSPCDESSQVSAFSSSLFIATGLYFQENISSLNLCATVDAVKVIMMALGFFCTSCHCYTLLSIRHRHMHETSLFNKNICSTKDNYPDYLWFCYSKYKFNLIEISLNVHKFYVTLANVHSLNQMHAASQAIHYIFSLSSV